MTEHHKHHDRTDHEREARRRRRPDRGHRGPSTKRINSALEAVESHAVPGQPPATELKVLKHVHDSEWNVGDRRIREFQIASGKPMRGELRSDDHISRYELELPLHEVDDATIPGATCPECGGRDVLYKYHANHHIAGYRSVFCLDCEERLHHNEWH